MHLQRLRTEPCRTLRLSEFNSQQDRITGVQRLLHILPVVNRDTLYVLLQFLGLVSENAEDKLTEEGKLYQAIRLSNSRAPECVFFASSVLKRKRVL